MLGPLWVWLVLDEQPEPASLMGDTLIPAERLANADFKCTRRVQRPTSGPGTHSPWTGSPLRAKVYLAMDGAVLRKFGQRVRELRLQRKLSQEALADEARLDRSYIGGVERGQRNVSLGNIDKIARALGIPLAYLFDAASAEATPARAGRRRRKRG